MAHSIAQQAASHPLLAYNFRVEIAGQSLAFTEVSGLARERRTLSYRHGLSGREGEELVVFRHDVFAPLVFKRGVVTSGLAGLYDWQLAGDMRALQVALCGPDGAPLLRWTVQRACLTKIEAPVLQAGGNEAAIETLTLMACGIAVDTV